MKILYFEAINFGSYGAICFTPKEGANLIYGPTGSGKSTIPDVPCWILFGKTAKGGSADDIINWETTATTRGKMTVELSDGTIISIERCRSKMSSKNDLVIYDPEPRRGKDASETQKIICSLLGFNFDLYSTAAYFHEFSPCTTFFVAKAKDRREFFETIADLSLPTVLSDNVIKAKRPLKEQITQTENEILKETGYKSAIEAQFRSLIAKDKAWEETNKINLAKLRQKAKDFDENKRLRITELENKSSWFWPEVNSDIDKLNKEINRLKGEVTRCDKCNQTLNEGRDTLIDLVKAENKIKDLKSAVNPYQDLILKEQTKENTYLYDFTIQKGALNPYREQLVELNAQHDAITFILSHLEDIKQNTMVEYLRLEKLYDLCGTLRSVLLANSVSQIEAETNNLLDKFFESQLKVAFDMKGSDNLEVALTKDQNPCVYRQLSKGQRGLLKLCFGVSVMKLIGHNRRIKFENIWFDEALDGLDSELKIKAYSLIENLSTEYGSIHIIEHDAGFQQMFNNKYRVEMIEDFSEIKDE